jgi:hypothetical protein
MNNAILSNCSNLTQKHRIVHTAMFMDPNVLPNFPESEEVKKLGQKIKSMFDEGVLAHISLDSEGSVVCF